MTTQSSLPRSLAPLADESLFGFLLRLAHRLEQSPHFLAKTTGLMTASTATMRIPTSHVLRLDPAQAARFAAACRLTDAETHGLTMAGLGNRYPPADHTINTDGYGARLRQAQGLPSLRRWMSTRPTRYCPQCLAGGSPIETDHGGPWRRAWHLPIVFACPLHQRLLAATCPACGRRPNGASPNLGLISASAEILHPAQCRSPVPGDEPVHRSAPQTCGHRLDLQPAPVATALARLLLPFQQRLTALLDDRAPAAAGSIGAQVSIAHYLMDLRLISVLIRVSWPDAAVFIASADITQAIQAFTDSQQDAWRGRHVRFTTFYDTPPADPAACGAILAAAEAVLAGDGTGQAEEMIRPMLTTAWRSASWRTFWLRSKKTCSPGIQELFQTVTQQLTGPRPRRPRPTYSGWLESLQSEGVTASSQDSARWFDHRHIPQHMTDAWFAEHFPTDPEIKPKHLRRIAAIRLVQMTVGGTESQAGSLLGIPPSCARTAQRMVMPWAADLDNAVTLSAAIRAFADTLYRDRDHLIDYGKRRTHLADWVIPSSDWEHLLAEIRETCRLRSDRLKTYMWADRWRWAASILVWESVTQGDRELAPPIRPGGPGHHDTNWIRRDLLFAADPASAGIINNLVATLTTLLTAYTHQLASAIDQA